MTRSVIASSILTGALPAIDGSALTGIDKGIDWQPGASLSTSASAIDWTGIPSTAQHIIIIAHDVSNDGSDWQYFRFGTSSGFITSGYGAAVLYCSGNTSYQNSATTAQSTYGASWDYWGGTYSGVFHLRRVNSDIWSWHLASFRTDNGANSTIQTGSINLGGTLTQIRFFHNNNINFTSGAMRIGYGT